MHGTIAWQSCKSTDLALDSAGFTKTTATNYTVAWKAVVTLVSFSIEGMDHICLTTRRIVLASIFY